MCSSTNLLFMPCYRGYFFSYNENAKKKIIFITTKLKDKVIVHSIGRYHGKKKNTEQGSCLTLYLFA